MNKPRHIRHNFILGRCWTCGKSRIDAKFEQIEKAKQAKKKENESISQISVR